MGRPANVWILFILAVSLSGCLPVFNTAQAQRVEKTMVASSSVWSTATPIRLPTAAPTPTPIFPVTMHTTTLTEETADQKYILQVSYPQLDWGNDTRVDSFNQAVEAVIQQEMNAFREIIAQVVSPASEEPAGFLQIRYQLLSSSYGILAFEFSVDTYIAPAAHPGRRTVTMNYDMVAGKVLALDELFLSGSPYLDTLSQMCLDDLTERDAIAWDSGALPTPENYQAWNITEEGLRITFDEYQVTSYAQGPQVVVIPYRQLKEIIPPSSRLAGFLN